MTTLRKTVTRDVEWAVATYSVLEDDEAIGTVTKYDMPGERNVGSRRRPHYTPRRVTRWSADTGSADDELHERRKDAVDLVTLMHERTKQA
jgi:hypothetical protein